MTVLGKNYRIKAALLECSKLTVARRSLDRLPSAFARRYRADPAFRARVKHRGALASVVAMKRESTKLIGCTKAELRAHIESLFSLGMTWKNYGEWVIDHIRPVCSFDILKESEVRKCFHFTNLQPIWKCENQAKIKYDMAKARKK